MMNVMNREALTKQEECRAFAKNILEKIISLGVTEFCLCAGSRNAPLIYPLVHASHVTIYHWTEERSAAYFALGRIKATGRPAAIITTSGTAAGELLPAAMEAYYTGLPLVLITADRPRRFRGTGAPQSVEQKGLFGVYAQVAYDVAAGDSYCFDAWDMRSPMHVNVCFEEPSDADCQGIRIDECSSDKNISRSSIPFSPDGRYLAFLQKSCCPFVIVGALRPEEREAVIRFLLHLNAPLYAEGISHLREEVRLDHLRIRCIENVWQISRGNGYPIDGVLRIGGVPTARLWRDLEYKAAEVAVCSISEQSFSGLSCAGVIQTALSPFLDWAQTVTNAYGDRYEQWVKSDFSQYQKYISYLDEEPLAEPSLIHTLSERIPEKSKVYLGNSLPIREWDQAATYQQKFFHMACSRGTNGIDGQFSTFLGFCSKEQENWALLGDLTALYDLVAPWIMSQLKDISASVVIVNNGGAGIFSKMYRHPAFYNQHKLSFEPLARFWGWDYEKWESVPEEISSCRGGRLIELIPNADATERLFKRVRG